VAEEPGNRTADEEMTDFETVMWILDSDPRLSSAFANLTVLDRPPERTELRRRMEAATVVVPKLRQRVVEQGSPLATPMSAAAGAGARRPRRLPPRRPGGDLDELVASLSARPFDRERPLWEFIVVTGLPEGRAAMIQRLDHTITDGEGGIRLSAQFLDLERDPARPTVRADDTGRTAGVGADPAREGPEPDDAPSDGAGTLADRAVENLRGIASAPGAALRSIASVPNRTTQLLDSVVNAFQQLAVDGRRSPLWTERSTQRWFGRTTLHLDDVKQAAHALGGTVNDLFVTGALAAASQVHRDAGRPTEELRVAIPISTRTDRSAGGNAFTPAHTLLPAGDLTIEERFGAVHERVGRVKRGESSVSIDAAAVAVRLMPASALIGFAARTAGAVDFVCSNVRAAPFDLYIAGSLLEANYPLGPLVNTAFNLTTMSYRGWMFLGLVADPVAVRDPDALLTALDDAYSELFATAGITRRAMP